MAPSFCREQWLAAAQKVFQSLDSQSNGLTMERLMCVLREKLPAAEIEYAVEDALVDAGYKGGPITPPTPPLLSYRPVLQHRTIACRRRNKHCWCANIFTGATHI